MKPIPRASAEVTGALRVLLLADTHLGFDTPRRPRSDRPRRGEDFWRCQRAALEPAFAGQVDLVIHGGDLLYRSKVPPDLVEHALAPYLDLARAGTPVLIVPGNHERGWIPASLFSQHDRLVICNTPRTLVLEGPWGRAAITGIPWRRVIHGRLSALLEEAGWARQPAELRLLCLHQAVEGAVVGPGEFVFRRGEDVVAAAELPSGADAVLCGHIHRGQILRRDLAGNAMPCPVIYPGSVERTSFAEAGETKQALLLEFQPGRGCTDIQTLPLPARSMVARVIELEGLDAPGLERALERILENLPRDAVLGLYLKGRAAPALEPLLATSALRKRLPPELRLTLNRRPRFREEPRDA